MSNSSLRGLARASFVLALALAGCKQPVTPTDGGSDPTPDPEACVPQVTMGTPLRLLTRAEYNFTVRDLLGATGKPAADFPREPTAHGLDNDATLNQVTDSHVSAYLDAAETLAKDTLANRRGMVLPCNTTDQSCGEQFIADVGLRAFRRPLNAEERANLNTLFSTLNTTEGFDGAVEVTLQAMLQSPQFLYRDEQALAPVPQPVVTLAGYEIASRLSYFLWGSMPDKELLEAAANGTLNSPAGIKLQAERMLADPRANDGLMRFFALWLYFDGVENTEKFTGAYPQYTHELAKAWRSSLELFVRDVLDHEGTLPALLTSNVMYTNSTMSMYGPTTGSTDFVRNVMPNQRKGLLTQPGFLAFKAMPDGSSPVRRGVFVLDFLLCQPPPPPPAGANIVPPEPSTTLTTRDRFAAHSTSPGCKGCHQFIDPVGFTFEHYDGLGQWRDTENGQPINSSGEVVTSTDSTVLGPVADIGELADKLAQSPRVHECLTKEFYRFALGRALNQADTCTVAQLSDRFFKSGGKFRELMLAIVESEAFRTNANPEMTP